MFERKTSVGSGFAAGEWWQRLGLFEVRVRVRVRVAASKSGGREVN